MIHALSLISPRKILIAQRLPVTRSYPANDVRKTAVRQQLAYFITAIQKHSGKLVNFRQQHSRSPLRKVGQQRNLLGLAPALQPKSAGR
jgi:hypothetical protein